MVDYNDAHKDQFGVVPSCQELPIAPSTYYASKNRAPSARMLSDEIALGEIRRVHADNPRVHGARKVHAQVRREGHRYARCTLERLMRRDGLGVAGAAHHDSWDPAAWPLDLVERAFTATAPDQLWVAEVTYIRTFAG